jgi:hypothetical protein
MKQLLGLLAIFALLAGASALAVDRFDDRELFVPPPDAVAEGYVRSIVTGRYSQARPYLADESSVSDEELRALDQSFGDPWDVEANLIARDGSRALANVRVSGPDGSHAMAFTLQFDREWKIVR